MPMKKTLAALALLLCHIGNAPALTLDNPKEEGRCRASYNPIDRIATLPCVAEVVAGKTTYRRVEMRLEHLQPPFFLHTLSANETPPPDSADSACISHFDDGATALDMPCLRVRNDKNKTNFHIAMRRIAPDASGRDRFVLTLIEVKPEPTSPAPKATKARVVLLLHGMSSDENTWNDYVRLEPAFGNAFSRCPTITLGIIRDPLALPREAPPPIQCFRLRFGTYDSVSGRRGVEGNRAFGPRSGDFSNFDTLGREVREAIQAISRRYRARYEVNLKIALVAHSRGGLAARAFLQGSQGQSEKDTVVALVTTGTPHDGSPLGRIHRYLRDYCQYSDGSRRGSSGFLGFFPDDCYNDWQVVDFLRSRSNCSLDNFIRFFSSNGDPDILDVRRPTIDDLSDDSSSIRQIQDAARSLPTRIQYAALKYTGIELGKLAKSYRIFDLAGFDSCDQVSKQAENYLLYPTYSNRGENLGDGIVPAANQAFPTWLPVSEFAHNPSGWLHIEEPKPLTGQQAHISTMLEFLLHWGF